MKDSRIVAVLILLAICFVACTSKEKPVQLNAEQSAVKSRLEAQMKEAAQTAKNYHAMDNTTLLSHLLEQSKAQREPFNSLAFRELKTRANVDSTALTALVKDNQNAGGLLPLLLLRRLDNKAYLGVPTEMRVKVLADALQASKTFNTWGLPGVYLEDGGNALIETGLSAVPALTRMLSETRLAPLFGSKEHMLAQQYKYRLCDYALFFLKRIEGDAQFVLPKTSDERDVMIKHAYK
jgi:hypothetical protein